MAGFWFAAAQAAEKPMPAGKNRDDVFAAAQAAEKFMKGAGHA